MIAMLGMEPTHADSARSGMASPSKWPTSTADGVGPGQKSAVERVKVAASPVQEKHRVHQGVDVAVAVEVLEDQRRVERLDVRRKRRRRGLAERSRPVVQPEVRPARSAPRQGGGGRRDQEVEVAVPVDVSGRQVFRALGDDREPGDGTDEGERRRR